MGLRIHPVVLVIALILAFGLTVSAQTTEFTYQGSLSDNSQAANGNYDFEFALFDALSAGTQLGSTITVNSVSVSDGSFTVKLDFGGEFPGAGRWLEIRVRQSVPAVKNAVAGSFTALSPRQAVTSTPYAVKSLDATTATNAAQLGGVDANQFVLTTDPRMTDARTPTSGSADYIQNTTTQQSSSDFNISGTGTGNIFDAAVQYNINGSKVLSIVGSDNIFAGVEAGQSNTTGNANSFFGRSAGRLNTTGFSNSFVGVNAGSSNISGSANSFFGTTAGQLNTTGSSNSFFGRSSGQSNSTGFDNSFFGKSAGQSNSLGNSNSFFGWLAGFSNTTGAQNSFFGKDAGRANTVGNANTIIGFGADVGSNNLSFATAIGSGAIVSTSNTVQLGRSNGSDTVNISGNLVIGGTLTGSLPGGSSSYIQNSTNTQFNSDFHISGTGKANIFNANVQYNIGGNHILSAPTNPITQGRPSLFAGVGAGQSNTTGLDNSFFGRDAGLLNTTASNNSFFGSYAGESNTGSNNSFFGWRAGDSNTTGIRNSFFGSSAGQSNSLGNSNSFFGWRAGDRNTTGGANSFIGVDAGERNTTGANNSFFGRNAGDTNTIGSDNTIIGQAADVGSDNLSNATAIGASAVVTASNTIQLGRDTLDTVRVGKLGTAAPTPLCLNGSKEIATCASSIRYKSNIVDFRPGLSLIRKLRPVSFNWKDGGMLDVGLVAEEVEKIEPLLTTRNRDGQIEGVKYDRVGVVLVNAVKEQQVQIEEQQEEIEDLNGKWKMENEKTERQKREIDRLKSEVDALKEILCELKPEAAGCKSIDD